MIKKVFKLFLILALAVIFLNAPLTTRQGVNGKIRIFKIPLYIKIIEFIDRDYRYKTLLRKIIKDDITGEEKVIKLFNWVIENIRKHPKGFPVIDDHVWSIIVRGYGTSDQAADVFTTLASYAGYEAFWEKLIIRDSPGIVILSFVRIGNEWHIFDVYNKRYFIDKKDLMSQTPYGPTYGEYLAGMDKAKLHTRIRRPDKQKIYPRLVYEFKKIFLLKKEKFDVE